LGPYGIAGIPDIPARAKAGTPKTDGFTGAGIGTAGFLAFVVGKVKAFTASTGAPHIEVETGAEGLGAEGADVELVGAEEGTIAPKSGVAMSLIACVTYF
jgi:hypothetical protein